MQFVIKNKEGKLLQRAGDFWFVKNCNDASLKGMAFPQNYEAEPFRGISKNQSCLINNCSEEQKFRIEADAGKQYAKISGDFNVIHTTHLGAILSGHPKPFLQGYGILNH